MIGIFHLDIFDGLVRNFCIWYAAPNLYIPSFWFSLQSWHFSGQFLPLEVARNQKITCISSLKCVACSPSYLFDKRNKMQVFFSFVIRVLFALYRQTGILNLNNNDTTDCRPTIGRLSVDCRPTIGRLSTDISTESTYSTQDPVILACQSRIEYYFSLTFEAL